MRDPRRGLLIILSSPSGAGKSTLSRMLLEWSSDLQFSVSATTRAPRPGEQDGVDYYFKTHEEFDAMVNQGQMLEHARVFDNSYGSPRGPVEAAIADGQDIIFDVDWQGGQQIRASDMAADVLSVFILPPSIAALEERLVKRDQDSAKVVAGRMAKSRDEISHWREYEYVLINEDLQSCFERLKMIVSAARLRREARPSLNGFVDKLNSEFEAMP